MTKEKQESLLVTKRSEFISDIIIECKAPVYNTFMSFWKQIYTSKDIPQRYWLEKFQLKLKDSTTIEHNTLLEYVQRSTRKNLLHSLYEAYLLTGELYHNEKPLIREDIEILLSFLKDVLVKTARDIWYSPFIFFQITHKKDKMDEAKHSFDKIYVNAVKYTLRQQTNEMIITQRSYMQKHVDKLELNEQPNQVPEPNNEIQSLSDDTISEFSSESEDVIAHDTAEKHQTKEVELNSQAVQPKIFTEKYILDDNLTLKPETLSRSSSFKAIISDEDSDEDLFIPRKPTVKEEEAIIKPEKHKYHKHHVSAYYKGNPMLTRRLQNKITR
jgi:hypothetical protein